MLLPEPARDALPQWLPPAPCLQRVASVKPGARKSRAHILENVSSVLHPGRFTLLLGPPVSAGGC